MIRNAINITRKPKLFKHHLLNFDFIMHFQRFCLLAIVFFVAIVENDSYRDISFYDDDYSSEDETVVNSCDPTTNCLLPNCSCFGKVPLGGDLNRLPQFVMLTFDDAITTLNVKTYRQIANGRRNPNGCPITMTFFVCHEYNDYQFVNELYSGGHEMAVHSITHLSNTDMWKRAPIDRWREEMVGMRRIISRYASIPESQIKGHRAPFLQTAGDNTFSMLSDNGFEYDSSMPTRTYMDPPVWPYTLDFGYQQDCQIAPCPRKSFPDLWLFPMVQWKRVSKTNKEVPEFHCSMLDACTPYPTNETDTIAYMMDNFERHYTSNKAPFPIFLHEAWLRDKARFKGFLSFLDSLLKKDDVFVVTIGEVLKYMRNPVSLEEYKSRKGCFQDSKPKAGACDPLVCNYRKRNILMKSCIPCPKRFPWLGNTEGKVIRQ